MELIKILDSDAAVSEPETPRANATLENLWETIKPIGAFSCTPRVQEVHKKR